MHRGRDGVLAAGCTTFHRATDPSTAGDLPSPCRRTRVAAPPPPAARPARPARRVRGRGRSTGRPRSGRPRSDPGQRDKVRHDSLDAPVGQREHENRRKGRVVEVRERDRHALSVGRGWLVPRRLDVLGDGSQSQLHPHNATTQIPPKIERAASVGTWNQSSSVADDPEERGRALGDVAPAADGAAVGEQGLALAQHGPAAGQLHLHQAGDDGDELGALVGDVRGRGRPGASRTR